MRRFYLLDLQPVSALSYPTEREAQAALKKQCNLKKRRGYG
jgi:hypothetical protein